MRRVDTARGGRAHRASAWSRQTRQREFALRLFSFAALCSEVVQNTASASFEVGAAPEASIVSSSQWVFPAHVSEFLANHTAQEYHTRLSKCMVVNFTANRSFGIDSRFPSVFARKMAAFLRTHHIGIAKDITVGVAPGDVLLHDTWPCLAYSTPPRFAQNAFLTGDDLVYAARKGAVGTHLPWKDRATVPVFRGALWWSAAAKDKTATSLQQILELEMALASRRSRRGVPYSRLVAIMHSLAHPTELDARCSGITFHHNHPIWTRNQSNGVHALINFSVIPIEKYYGGFQTALVLGGIGAAFRLGNTLGSGTAVILEDYPLQLWFTRFLRPFVHYIPLAYGAANLTETLAYVRENPEVVRHIATMGRVFYESNLSPDMCATNFKHLLARIDRFLSSHNS